MKKLIILLILLAVCLPAYSQSLVYSVTLNVRGAMGPVEDGETMVRRVYHGYIIVSGDLMESPDMVLIMYGRDGNKRKVYEFIDIFLDDYFLLQKRPFECVVGVAMSEEDNWATLTGFPRMWNIGGGMRALIPRVLAGHILLWGDMPFTNDVCYGCGTIGASLRAAWTIKYNRQGMSFGEVINAVEAYLITVGYREYGAL